MVNYADIDFSQFIPEGLGAFETFNVPTSGSPMTAGMSVNPAQLNRSAMGREVAAEMENQKRAMMMRQMMNVIPGLARTHRNDPMAMGMAGAIPGGLSGIKRREANTGSEEFRATLAHQMQMAEAQGSLMEYIHSISEQPWYKEWAPVIGSILGALGGPLGSSIGGGIGETYARSDL